MPNPSKGFSPSLNGKTVTKIGSDNITATNLLSLPSIDARFEVRKDTENIDMLLINQSITLTFSDTTTASSVPVDYVGSTPVHF